MIKYALVDIMLHQNRRQSFILFAKKYNLKFEKVTDINSGRFFLSVSDMKKALKAYKINKSNYKAFNHRVTCLQKAMKDVEIFLENLKNKNT